MTDHSQNENVRLLHRLAKKTTRAFFATHMPPGDVDYDDVVQAVWIAGWEALKRFDETMSASLTTFMTHRMRGALIDHLRDISISSRGRVARLKQQRDAVRNDRR